MFFDRCIGFAWGAISGISFATGSPGYAAICAVLCFVTAILFPAKIGS